MAGGEVMDHRHPELVSGPILRLTRTKRWQAQPHRQVRPMRVVFVDEVDLPLPMPAFELLFAQDCRVHVTEPFEMNEGVNTVLRSKSGNRIAAMLPDARDKIGSNPDVNRAVGLTGKDVDAGLAFVSHGPEIGGQWILKQVQDDEKGYGSRA